MENLTLILGNTFLVEAKKRKHEIELSQINKTFIPPNTKTVEEFLSEWMEIYGEENWQYGTYTTNVGLLNNHVLPYIGEIPLQQLAPLDIEKLYSTLSKKKVSGAKCHRDLSDVPCLSSTTIRLIHTMLKRAFESAVEWKQIPDNPVTCKAPKKSKIDDKIWDATTVAKALQDIKHDMLHLAVHLSFICSLRVGEAMGLTWDCVDLDKGFITINKTCQRVSKKALDALPGNSLIQVFSTTNQSANSVIVLKEPKTKSSNRIIYLTQPLIHELRMRKQLVAKEKCFHNRDYQDANLVFCSEYGLPIEPKLCEKWFNKWLARTEGDFPKIIFHKIRHSATTYKLLIGEGDYKSVQADNGHASADMTLNTYSHIQNEARLNLVHRVEEDFYTVLSKTASPNTSSAKISEEDAIKLVLNNPELLARCLKAQNAQNA